ncbi:MAG: RNase adapter RapZ [Elusimicrobia bacterium]|nr:RNase adapter RapZ [Elusimicrobiota bacterium]
MKKPEIIIITGLSGAGKSIAIKSIEDFGGFCVDNMPAVLIVKFVKLILGSDYSKSIIALGIDVRSRGFMDSIFEILKKTKKLGYNYKIVFIEASNSTILRRYNESRRRHPLSAEKESLSDTIRKERKKLAPLREKADYIIDTTGISPHQLKQKLRGALFKKGEKTMSINVTAFGFKYGIPENIDLLIDTRFLPNPHYDSRLSSRNGNSKTIEKFVMSGKKSHEFVSRYKDLLDFLVPNYAGEGRSYLNIGVGCTGGKHRSVVVANSLCRHLQRKGFKVFAVYRDINTREG